MAALQAPAMIAHLPSAATPAVCLRPLRLQQQRCSSNDTAGLSSLGRGLPARRSGGSGGVRGRVVTRAVVLEGVPREYGLVALVAASSAVLVQWQAIQVALKRRECGLQYPKMYEDKDDSLFNCYQRAHQNTLENYPSFLALLLVSGAAYPIVSGVFGVVWVVGRVFYSLGYYTGDPKNRTQGMWGTFGLLGLIGTCAVLGVKQLL